MGFTSITNVYAKDLLELHIDAAEKWQRLTAITIPLADETSIKEYCGKTIPLIQTLEQYLDKKDFPIVSDGKSVSRPISNQEVIKINKLVGWLYLSRCSQGSFSDYLKAATRYRYLVEQNPSDQKIQIRHCTSLYRSIEKLVPKLQERITQPAEKNSTSTDYSVTKDIIDWYNSSKCANDNLVRDKKNRPMPILIIPTIPANEILIDEAGGGASS